MILIGTVFGLLLIWSLGYILVIALAPGVFVPRPVEAAVALLLGLCATGLFTMVTARLAPDPVWFQRAIRWTVPLLVVGGGGLLVLRHRSRLLALLQTMMRQPTDGRVLLRALAPWSSAAVLLVGTALILAYRPGPEPTIELYTTRVGQNIQVTVTSTSEQEQRFVLVVRSVSGEVSAAIPLDPVSFQTGPVTTTLETFSSSRIELYESIETVATNQPLRWINVVQ